MSSFKERVNSYNKYLESKIKYGYKGKYQFVSCIWNSLGYPPNAFRNWEGGAFNIGSIILNLVDIPVSIVDLIYKYKIAIDLNHSVKNKNVKFFQYQYQTSIHRRKDISNSLKINVLNDLNISFLEKNINIKKNICSFGLLSFTDLTKIIFKTFLYLLKDIYNYPTLVMAEKKCFRRILFDLSKCYSIENTLLKKKI